MDINRRKTGLGRLIEIAGTKRWLLIGAMSLAVITAIVQFTIAKSKNSRPKNKMCH